MFENLLSHVQTIKGGSGQQKKRKDVESDEFINKSEITKRFIKLRKQMKIHTSQEIDKHAESIEETLSSYKHQMTGAWGTYCMTHYHE